MTLKVHHSWAREACGLSQERGTLMIPDSHTQVLARNPGCLSAWWLGASCVTIRAPGLYPILAKESQAGTVAEQLIGK